MKMMNNQLKEMMYEMKRLKESGEFNSFYERVFFSGEPLGELALSDIELYIYEAITTGGYENEDAKGMGSIMLGFSFGDFLVENLPGAKWVFKENPASWSDFHVQFRTKKMRIGTVSVFSATTRCIHEIEKKGFNIEGNYLTHLFKELKKMK